MKTPISLITVALYNKGWPEMVGDRLGIRVRFYRRNSPKDFYPSAGLLKWMMCLAHNHRFAQFTMKGKQRISIR